MKKKAEQKKEIVPAFEPALFWEYQACPPQTVDKIDTFINTFANELKALIVPEKSLEENYQCICQKAGYAVHPALVVRQKEQSKFPTLKSNDYGDKFAIFLSCKIDLVTLKLLGFLIQNYKISCLKFSNNNLEHQAEEIKKIISRQGKYQNIPEQLTTLYFEWNPLKQYPQRQEVFLTCVRPSLHHLILRQCHMGDEIVKELIKKIKEVPDCKIKSLDLYGNDLTPTVVQDISTFLEQSKTIEFLGLSKNAFNNDECMKKLLSAIGEVPLSEEEFEKHKLKEKQRDQVVERNKKRKKGAPQQPVPVVLEVKETPNGRVYVKNTSLKILNLAGNTIKDSCATTIRNFLSANGKDLQLFIEGNKFSKATKETFKFYPNVIY